MKEKHKPINARLRWAFILLVIVISSGMFLWQSHQNAESQKLQYAERSCFFLPPDERGGCVYVMLRVEEFVEAGLSAEELIEILKQIYPPREAEANQ